MSGAVRGEILFGRCAGCHATGEGEAGALGPELAGVVGREIASPSAGFTFTPALRAAGGVWNPERLDAFLADPAGFAPGTSMQVEGIRDPGQRADLIDFLATLR